MKISPQVICYVMFSFMLYIIIFIVLILSFIKFIRFLFSIRIVIIQKTQDPDIYKD